MIGSIQIQGRATVNRANLKAAFNALVPLRNRHTIVSQANVARLSQTLFQQAGHSRRPVVHDRIDQIDRITCTPNLAETTPRADPAPAQGRMFDAPAEEIVVNMNAYQKQHYQKLLQENKKLRRQVEALTSALDVAMEKLKQKPAYLDYQTVKGKLRGIVTKILLGSFPNSTMYPTELTMAEAILMTFDVDGDNTACAKFFSEWDGNTGSRDLKKLVMKNVRDRQGTIVGELKEELYRLLDLPKPKRNATFLEKETWRKALEQKREGDQWRVNCVNGCYDPFGSLAFHGAISRVMQEECYQRDAPICITSEQAGFFLYAMELAMKDERFNPLDMPLEKSHMKNAEARFMAVLGQVQNVHILEQGAQDEEMEDTQG